MSFQINLILFSTFLTISFGVRSDLDNTAFVSSPNTLLGTTCTGTVDTANIVYCPDQTWAYGFQLVTSQNYGILDIILDCRSQYYNYAGSSWNISTSTLVHYANLGTFGTLPLKYSSFVYCPGRDFIRGYFLRMWCPASVSDDPQGIVEIKMRCSFANNIESNFHSTNAASWTGYSNCKPGFAICGYEMKYNSYAVGIHFGAVDIGLKCCRVCDIKAGFFFSASNVCDFCDITCKECSGTATYCTKCPPGYTLTSSNTCTTTTPYTLISNEFFSSYTYGSSWNSNYVGGLTTTCSPFSFIGGYNVLDGATKTLTKSLTSLGVHTTIEIRYCLYSIGTNPISNIENPLFYGSDCGNSNYLQRSYRIYGFIYSDVTAIDLVFSFTGSTFWAVNRVQTLIFSCHTSCQTCSGVNSNQCTSCSSGYLTTSGTCSTICSTSTFAILETGKCSTTCPFPLYKDPLNQACNAYCPSNYYINDADRTCYNPCPTGTYGNPLTTKCVGTCPDGMFGDGATSLCAFCSFNCDTCSSSSTNCITCKYTWLGASPGCSNPSYIQIIEDRIFKIESVTHSNVQSSGWTVSGALNTINYGNQWTIGWFSYKLAGGSGVFGYETSITKSFTSLSPHLYARITFYFTKIGTWYYNLMKIILDGSNSLATLTFNYNNDVKCNINDIDYAICFTSFRRVDVFFAHSSVSMDLSIMTDLTTLQGDSFWGISDLTLMLSLCHSSCKTCYLANDGTQCMSCDSVLFLQVSPGPSNCLATCPSNKYKIDNKCLSCHISCLSCQGGTISDCLTCSSTYLLSPPGPSTCLSTCNLGTYANTENYECSSCDSTCEGCNAFGNTFCTSCNGAKYLQVFPAGPSQCLTTCPSHTFPDSTSHVCKPCDVSCDECNGNTDSSCTKCSGTNYLLSPPGPSKCLSTCNLGTYANTINNECSPCETTCAECNAFGNMYCTSCNGIKYLQVSPAGPSQCLTTCPTHTFPDSTSNICEHCDASCDECNGDTDILCTKCSTNYLLVPPGPSKCSPSCNVGTYANSANNECSPCDSSCATCNAFGNTFCISCNGINFLQVYPAGPSECLITCPSHTFPDSTSHVCKPCDVSCDECDGDTDFSCIKCSGTNYLLSPPGPSKCAPSCSAGTYADITNNECSLCDSSCKTCNGFETTSCISCHIGSYLRMNECFETCPPHTFPDLTSELCQDCDVSCDECNSASDSSCTKCSINYLLLPPNPSKCSVSCPDHTYPDSITHICEHCDASCEECNGVTNSSCTKCTTNYLLFPPGPSLCSPSCFIGTYPNETNHECSPCDLSCKGCFKAGDTSCTSCNSGKHLKSNPGPSQCIEKCPITYYQDAFTDQCKQCDASCYGCLDSGPFSCFSCTPGTYLNAPEGPATCLSCNSLCLTCVNSSESACLSCHPNTYLQSTIYPSSCLESCPDGLFPDSSDYTCKCARPCQTCSGLTVSDCLSCAFNLYLQKAIGPSSCLPDCPKKKFKSDSAHTCRNCDPSCYNCSGNSSLECLSCVSGKFLDNSTNSCKVCDSSCIECINDGRDGCTKCISEYYFQKNNGSSEILSGQCVDYPKIIPILKNCSSALSYILTFSSDYYDIYLSYMSKTTIAIDGIQTACYSFNISPINGTNNFAINFYNVNCSITEYQLMHINLNPPVDILSNYSIQLSTYNLTNRMQYYYKLNEEQKSAIHKTTQATEILTSITSKSFPFNNLISFIFSFIFQCLVSLYLIWFLRYFHINYPENILSIFNINPEPSVIPNISFDEHVSDGTLPDIFKHYTVSIYTFNNNGNLFIETFSNWVLGFISLLLLNHFIGSKYKIITVTVILVSKIFVWSYGLGFFLSNYMIYSFYAFLSFRYPCTKTNIGLFNLFFSIFLGFIVIISIPILFLKFKNIRKKVIPINDNITSMIIDTQQPLKENKTIDKTIKKRVKRNAVETINFPNIIVENLDTVPPSKESVHDLQFSSNDIFRTSPSNVCFENPFLPKKSKFSQVCDSPSPKKNSDLLPSSVKVTSFGETMVSPITDSRKSTSFNLNSNRTNNNLKRYNLMHKDFKQKNFFQSSYILWNLLKQLIYTMFVVTMFDKPFSGLILIMILDIIYILYLALVNPFKKTTDFLHALFNECCVLCAIISAFCLAYMDKYDIIDEEMKINFGWAMVISNLVLILAFVIRMFISWTFILYSVFKELGPNLIRKIKKNRVGIEEQSKKDSRNPDKQIEMEINNKCIFN